MRFIDLPAAARRRLLARPFKGAVTKAEPASGLAAEVWFIRQRGEHSPGLAAKVPCSRYGALEDARAFIREIEFQRRLAWHQFVHWPFRTEWINDTPIAWYRRRDGDLASKLNDPTFSTAGRIAFLVYLIDALVHCHGRGLDAHQDLKPENILVWDRSEGVPPATAPVVVTPLLADLGSANLAALIGEYGGTAPYMAPEQWRREPLSAATSVWSIGVIGYELLSGGVHPSGKRIRNARGKINVSSSKFKATGGAFNPSLPLDDGELDALFRRCMAASPDDRPSLKTLLKSLRAKLASDSNRYQQQVDLMLTNPYGRTSSAWDAFEVEFEIVKQQAVDRFGPAVLAPPTPRGPADDPT